MKKTEEENQNAKWEERKRLHAKKKGCSNETCWGMVICRRKRGLDRDREL